MIVDNAFANSEIHWISEGGDTGKGRVEHRSFLLLWFTHNKRIRSDTTGASIGCFKVDFYLKLSE
jgi:hypothetical protein